MRKNTFINISLVGDKEIHQLNKKHLKRDYATDVLSFNMNEELPDGRYYLGDVIVNLDKASTQALENHQSLEQEVARLVEHGVKHLLGVHHEGDS
ncbi:rRNA maturation RNase YbeY [Candidatus Parcubacteria bacterium]|nr:rRNA maturation RNase YbeY [Patescibacteria group bacterium]MCG2689031.1 rRNA maturation RNase YbeY [Candidatus Parcubacteria bacterium]